MNLKIYSWSDEDHDSVIADLNYSNYLYASITHATRASELMASVKHKEDDIPYLQTTDPRFTEALIHAQLSTTYAILSRGKK